MSQQTYPIDYTVYSLRCGEECPHYDPQTRFCWHTWKYIKEHETCHAGIQVKHIHELIYPPETRRETGI